MVSMKKLPMTSLEHFLKHLFCTSNYCLYLYEVQNCCHYSISNARTLLEIRYGCKTAAVGRISTTNAWVFSSGSVSSCEQRRVQTNSDMPRESDDGSNSPGVCSAPPLIWHPRCMCLRSSVHNTFAPFTSVGVGQKRWRCQARHFLYLNGPLVLLELHNILYSQ